VRINDPEQSHVRATGGYLAYGAAPQLLADLGCRYVIANRGYDADAMLAVMRAAGAKPISPQPLTG
jgi:hypothetical protein